MRFSYFTRWLPALALGLGLTLAGGSAQAQLTKKASIQETLKCGSYSAPGTAIDKGNAGETPVRMSSTTNGNNTGFTWGAYMPSATMGGSTPSACWVLDYNGSNSNCGIFLVYNWCAGTYFYTLFSSGGTKTPDQYVDLSGANAAISWYLQQGGANNTQVNIRWMIRTNSGTQWYVSNPVTLPNPIPSAQTLFTSQLAGLSWYKVTSAVNTNLNALAGSDEGALAFDTTPSTPDLTKVDGGGWMIDQGTDAYTNSFKPTRLTWTSNAPVLKAVGTPSYPMQPSSLVLGPGAATGQLALINANPGPITITGLQVNSPDGQIALVSPPALPQSASATSTMTLNLKYLATSVDTSSATLYVTCNQDGTPGTIVQIPLVGRPLKNASVEENFKGSGAAPNPSDLHIASARNTSPNQKPVIMNPPIYGAGNTGFKWGAFTNAVSNTGGRDWVALAGGGLAFAGAGSDDLNTGGNYHGSYAWTIFDSLGGNTPDYSLKLEKFAFYCNKAATGQQIRFLLRDATGQWFISDRILNSPVATGYVTYDLDGWTWRRVNPAAETYMNALSSIPQVAISEPPTLPVATLNLNGITGGGVYVETGDTNPSANPALAFPGLNWIVRPSDNDRMMIQAKNTFTSNTAIVANKRVGLMALNCTVTTGAEVALDGIDVTVNNATGLRTMFLYSDPNANGLPDDGAALTSCTVSGTTAKVRFIAPDVVQRGTPKNYCLAAVFDDTASSRTYTFTAQTASWKVSTVGGNGDAVIQNPATATATFKVQPLVFPDVTTLFKGQELKETWDGVAEGALPTTSGSGTVTGSDNPWSYLFGTTPRPNAVFTKFTSVMAGVETKDMTTEPVPYESFQFQNRNTFLTQIDQDLVRIARVDFTMQITSTTLSTLAPHFSPRPTSDYSNVAVRLLSSSGNYQFTFMPLTDWNAYAFTLNTANNPAEYAPANILAYSSGDGTGAYQVSLWFAPTGKNTIAKVDLKHVASGKTLSWVTLINGAIANISGLDLQFNNFANTYIDDIVVSTYAYRINPVKHWSMFE